MAPPNKEKHIMDMLKKELAPLSTKVWEEIEKRAAEVLQSRLSARKVVKVEGPKGWDYTAVPEGRLDLVSDGEVKSGVYRVKPLAETRVRFALNRWEMDNITRGAKGIDLDALDQALEKLADFEENTIYNGFAAAGIQGIVQAAAHKAVAFGTDAAEIMEAVSQAQLALRSSHTHSPYSLVVGKKAWMAINKEVQGIPLAERLERLLGGKVVLAQTLDGALLIPYDDENLEMTIGQDIALGYESHDTKTVTLFATESFTFRVLDPKRIICFTL